MATARWVKVYNFGGSGTGISLADIAFSTTGSGSPTDQATTVTGTATDDGGAILNLIDNTTGTVAAWSDFGTPFVELVFEIDAADVGVTHIGIRPTACDDRDPTGFDVRVSSDGTNYGPSIYHSNSGCSAGTFQWYALPPLVSEMWVRTIVCPRDSNLIDLTEIRFDFNGVGATLTPVTMTSSPAPTTGSLTTLYNGITVESVVQFTGSTTIIAKCTSTTNIIGVPNAIRLEPTSPTANFPYAVYSDYSTVSASGPWTHAGGSVGEIASNNWWINPGVTFSVCPAGDTLLNTTSAVDNMTYTVSTTGLLTEESDGTDATLLAPAYALSATAEIGDTPAGETLTMYLEAIGLGDTLASSANTTASTLDIAAIVSVAQQAIDQIAADTAAGSVAFSIGAALTLVDIANATMTQASTYNSVMLVAEVIATIEALNSVGSEDVMDTGSASDTLTARISALVDMLESHYIIDVDEVLVHVMQATTDTATGVDSAAIGGSVLNALLSDVLLATIRLNIGGELYTGWVLNTDTLAPSEYQFADRQFNSACKHGTKYLMAAEDGIYEFTNDAGVETVMTYVKTGKSDFGSDLKKRMVNSYMVYSASGNMSLKVTTSEYGQLQTRTYRMVPPANSETSDVKRFDLGRGIKSRYWQFELVGDGVDCTIDEIGMLPIVLSRRI